ncbi:MAG: alkaline phosphatase family protein [Candidatus Elarobacter sp.]
MPVRVPDEFPEHELGCMELFMVQSGVAQTRDILASYCEGPHTVGHVKGPEARTALTPDLRQRWAEPHGQNRNIVMRGTARKARQGVLRIRGDVRRTLTFVVTVLAVVAAGAWWYFRSGSTRIVALPAVALARGSLAIGRLPKSPRAIVVVVEENKDFDDIFGESDAPFINALAKEGALFTRSYGAAHPSQPNYFAMFAGQTNSNGDGCPARDIAVAASNVGASLVAAHRTFRAYVEDLPSAGFKGCVAGEYARKHAPWTHFTNVPRDAAVPFSTLGSYDALPDVAFVIPNLLDDMHSAGVRRGDDWLRDHVAPLIAWAKTHNGLVILTWDESSAPVTNHIPTIFIGPMVKSGSYDEPLTHYRVLRTIEDLFNLPHSGASAHAAPIVDVWR